MKRSPLKRGKPLTRSPLARSTKPLNAMSEHRRAEYDRRRELGAPPFCEVRHVLERAWRFEPDGLGTVAVVSCFGPLNWHERRKRSAGGSITISENLMGACQWHNGWIEDNPDLARKVGGTRLVVREGDLEYARLGRRPVLH